jgi:hypothetical protein
VSSTRCRKRSCTGPAGQRAAVAHCSARIEENKNTGKPSAHVSYYLRADTRMLQSCNDAPTTSNDAGLDFANIKQRFGFRRCESATFILSSQQKNEDCTHPGDGKRKFASSTGRRKVSSTTSGRSNFPVVTRFRTFSKKPDAFSGFGP